MIFPRVLQNSPERHIKVRDPLQIPVIKRILPEMPYLLAVDSKRILLGPGDQTVRMADRVISILFCFAVYLMFLGALGNLIWAFAGNVLKRFYSSHYKLMNGIMALLLVWCSLRITGLL